MTPYGILHKLATSFSKNQFQSFSDNLFISFDSDMKNGPSSLFLPSRSYFIIFQLEPINFTIFVAISSNSKTYFENRGIATNVDVLQEHILKKTANLHRFGGKIGRCIMSEILLIFGCPGCQVDFRNNLRHVTTTDKRDNGSSLLLALQAGTWLEAGAGGAPGGAALPKSRRRKPFDLFRKLCARSFFLGPISIVSAPISTSKYAF